MVKENSNIHLLLVGKGKLENFYRKKISKYNLQNNIHVLGYRNDVPKLFKISNCCISTSIREGLGLNVVEAMLIGIPILVTNNRGHRELIDDTRNGFLVEIDNEKQLVTKMQELISNEKLMKKFGDNARKKVEPYKLENVIKEMEKIYNNEE